MDRPVAAQYITRDTNLRISSWNRATGVTITIAFRRLDENGRLVVDEIDHVPNTDGTRKQTLHALAESVLVSVLAYVSAGTPTAGQTLVRVELVEGLTGAIRSSSTLLQDRITVNAPISWPGSLIRSPLDGAGNLRSITGTDPAANTEFSETVPTGVRWRPLSLLVPLVTDANVANRLPQLLIDDGANVYATIGASTVIAASQNGSVTWARGSFLVTPGGGNKFVQGFPDLVLPAGHRFRSSTINLQATDNYGPPQYLVEEWFDV